MTELTFSKGNSPQTPLLALLCSLPSASLLYLSTATHLPSCLTLLWVRCLCIRDRDNYNILLLIDTQRLLSYKCHVILYVTRLPSLPPSIYTLYTSCQNRDRVNPLSRGYPLLLSLLRLGRKLLLYNLVLQDNHRHLPPLRLVLRNSMCVLCYGPSVRLLISEWTECIESWWYTRLFQGCRQEDCPDSKGMSCIPRLFGHD